MVYSLYRTRDGAGDSGPMSVTFLVEESNGILSIATDENGKPIQGGPRPAVGHVIQVGSIYARTYQQQDYWMTTPITEILSDTGSEVRFKTGNSEYVWKEF